MLVIIVIVTGTVAADSDTLGKALLSLFIMSDDKRGTPLPIRWLKFNQQTINQTKSTVCVLL